MLHQPHIRDKCEPFDCDTQVSGFPSSELRYKVVALVLHINGHSIAPVLIFSCRLNESNMKQIHLDIRCILWVTVLRMTVYGLLVDCGVFHSHTDRKQVVWLNESLGDSKSGCDRRIGYLKGGEWAVSSMLHKNHVARSLLIVRIICGLAQDPKADSRSRIEASDTPPYISVLNRHFVGME
jgi:hypothetical protein